MLEPPIRNSVPEVSASEGKLEGTDTHAAFLSNLDEMTEHAREAGFDFDALVEFAGQ